MVVGCLVAVFARSCWQLAVAAVQFPALLCCDAMIWAVTFLASPLRLLAAVDRERKLDRLLGEMQRQMERLVWEKSELEERLSTVLEEHKAMEEVLDEMDDEHDDAFARISLLETQLKALRLENMRLNEHKGKSMWDKMPAAAAAHGGSNLPASKPDMRQSTARKRKDREEEEGGVAESAAAEEGGGAGAAEPLARHGKTVARRRSLFSLGMSLAVGAVVWTADAPCLPLLAGLFAMVGMSMCSVARFLRAALRRSRPASDAVMLLSLNWFLLGVLTSPMLPAAAHAVLPRAATLLLAGPAASWFAGATAAASPAAPPHSS